MIDDDFNIHYLPVMDNINSTLSQTQLRNIIPEKRVFETLKRLAINVPTMNQYLIMMAHNSIPSDSRIKILDLCCDYVTEFNFIFFFFVDKFFKTPKNLTVWGKSVSQLIPPRTPMPSVKFFTLHSQKLDM